MGSVFINTQGVVDVAEFLDRVNDRIKDDFVVVENKNEQLSDTWDGVVSDKAISAFNEIRSKYSAERYNIMKSYSTHLKSVVDPGYCATEEKNKSLAERFK